MKVAVVGGGPAGLYLSLLLKKQGDRHEVVLYERNPAEAAYGWGVVFSDRTLSSFREADHASYQQIIDSFIIWDSIDIRYRYEVIRCGGQVFSGISRRTLLGILQRRCAELGVELRFEQEVEDLAGLDSYDLVVAADGVRSVVREAHKDVFRPRFHEGRSRYIWFGTRRVFDSFTFCFRANEDGFFQAHAYPFDGEMSTFIVECDEASWLAAGLDEADEAASIDYCARLFAGDLGGHTLMSNASKWINFVTLKNKTWRHENVVLIGDAAHTAHFSIGSGTKLAMEDAIALAGALNTHQPGAALVEYELERKPRVERFQEAARQSQTYFENTRRYQHLEPLQFAFHLLSRSGRIDYDDLRVGDAGFVGRVDRWFLAETGKPRVADGTSEDLRQSPAFAAPPSFAPLTLRNLDVPNRIAISGTSTPSADCVPSVGTLAEPASLGAGLILSGTVAVSAHGRTTPGSAGIYDDAQQAGWTAEVLRARASSTAALAITLGHSGPRGSARGRKHSSDVALAQDGWTPIAASPQRYTARSAPAAEIDRERMDDVLEDFVRAARRALAAGFDMAEVHMAHGYLLGSFISPLTNQRTDDCGGTLADRLRWPLAVFDAVRGLWPPGLPVGAALSASDWARGGLTLDEAVEVARALKDHGCDIIRVLAGQTVARQNPRYDPYFLTHYADRLRSGARVATIATGDISDIGHANTIVAGGRADLCLLRI
jgi:anthraniloyl-CoA monooxygenase